MAITVGDILFVDTNVLLTATDETRTSHADARRLISGASRYGCHLALSGQVLREYLVVATRPIEVNGLGLSPGQAIGNLATFRRFALFFEETEATVERLGDLVRHLNLQGKRIHDANLVATMVTHTISHLITDNSDDFRAFSEITVITVADAASIVTGLAENERS